MSGIIEELLQSVGKESLLTAEEAANRPASLWLSNDHLRCKALLRPANTQEVSKALKICNEYGQTVIPHGGLTGVARGEKTGPEDIAISLERMNTIEEINLQNKTVTVQAGVILQDLQNAVADKGLLFPLDLGSKGSCMIGGNISTNAGGLQALRYGVTRQLVLGLEVVLADGTIISSMNKMLKNNAGYDLKQFFIGSEGTLGIITRAVLKLEDAPKSRNTAMVALKSFNHAVDFLNRSKRDLNSTLTTYEIFWNDYYRLMTTPPSEYKPPLAQDYPFYVLMETLGQDEKSDEERFHQHLESCLTEGVIEDASPATSHQEFANLWGIREKVELIFQIHQPVFLFDVSLPISEMENYISSIEKQYRSEWDEVHFYAYGHMGDGNLHMYVCCGEDDYKTRHRVEEIAFEPLKAIGGSVTAEHGLGLEKKPWVHYCRTPEELALMRTLKNALDPKGILNRGKVI
ncbi:FAD-binding oxidoreductase [Jiulongibacter sediminis]|jgi:FAD/FMN-containing dehydrogenase|uniref:FAD-binding oxidoreductase n=1 Tax=Jiulongibacter sediminis TaxID=1605367 RepID=UPI0026F223C9|nr:FAD-binding oxidoreductase [Jiulongibacter sediminis]